MKIAHIIFGFNTGGAETMLVDIINEQVKNNNVYLVIINSSYTANLIKKISKKTKIITINRKPESKNITDYFKINYFLIKISPKVIHCHNHNIIPIIFPYLWKKCVLTIHDVNIRSTYFQWYNKLFAISLAVHEDIKTRYNLISTIIYNGINIDAIEKKNLYQKRDTFKVLQIGRLDHSKKGQHLVIAAIKNLKDWNINNVKVDFIGSGDSYNYLIELSKKLKVEENINFLGIKTRDQIYEIIKDYDLLIQPSLYEGFGLTIVEGMAAGVPVLVSAIDGPMEIIDKGEYGFYFKAGDSQDLAIKINEILKSDIVYDKNYINKILKRASKFNIKHTVEEYIKHY